MQVSNRASSKALHALLNITDQEKQQQHILTRILLVGQADSALLKTLSMVATVCLPASLVAVSLLAPYAVERSLITVDNILLQSHTVC